jgi:hypothetical protein
MYEISGSVNLLNDRSLHFSGGIFNRLKTLSSNPTVFDDIYNIYQSFVDKDDRYDYYYASGWKFQISKKIIPQFTLGLTYYQAKETSGRNNSNFSIFKKDENYIINPPVNDGFNRTVGTFIRLDPNVYKAVDWGDGEISRFGVTNFPILDFSYSNTSKNLSSTYDFRKYSVKLRGRNYINRFLRVTYELGGIFLNGNVPYQNLEYFRTREDGSNSMIFETAGYQSFLGDRLYYFNFENDFGKLLWGNITFLKDLDLTGIFNIGRIEITDKNRLISYFNDYSPTNGYYVEAGFRIKNILSFLSLNFTWRLNNRIPGRNFDFYISAVRF